MTGDERTGELAQAAFDQVAKRSVLIAETLASLAKKPGAAEFGIGAFGPFGGAVYALAHAAVRHDRPEYAEAAAALLPAIDELVDEDPLLDIVSGSAGAILALLSLETARPGIGAARIAERCADRLLATRQERGEGWGWATPINPEEPLMRLLARHLRHRVRVRPARPGSPRPEYKEAVRHALTYERTAFDPELRTWRDLRPTNLGGRTVMNAWCHGAPGIAMARNAFQELGTVPELAELIESDRHMAVLAAISTGLDLDPVSGLGNHSLCHGDIGNLLIIDESSRADQEPEVSRPAAPGVEHAAARGPGERLAVRRPEGRGDTRSHDRSGLHRLGTGAQGRTRAGAGPADARRPGHPEEDVLNGGSAPAAPPDGALSEGVYRPSMVAAYRANPRGAARTGFHPEQMRPRWRWALAGALLLAATVAAGLLVQVPVGPTGTLVASTDARACSPSRASAHAAKGSDVLLRVDGLPVEGRVKDFQTGQGGSQVTMVLVELPGGVADGLKEGASVVLDQGTRPLLMDIWDGRGNQ